MKVEGFYIYFRYKIVKSHTAAIKAFIQDNYLEIFYENNVINIPINNIIYYEYKGDNLYIYVKEWIIDFEKEK